MEAKYPIHGIYTDLMNKEQREANEMAAHDLKIRRELEREKEAAKALEILKKIKKDGEQKQYEMEKAKKDKKKSKI